MGKYPHECDTGGTQTSQGYWRVKGKYPVARSICLTKQAKDKIAGVPKPRTTSGLKSLD